MVNVTQDQVRSVKRQFYRPGKKVMVTNLTQTSSNCVKILLVSSNEIYQVILKVTHWIQMNTVSEGELY